MRHIPDEYDMNWDTCPDCGSRYHIAEGCTCWQHADLDPAEEDIDEDINEELDEEFEDDLPENFYAETDEDD